MNKQQILSKTSDYHQHLLDSLSRKEEAEAYLRVALEEYELDGDSDVFMLALRNVAQAQGGIGQLAKKTELDRTHLYRILSTKGNPRLLTLDNILRAMGFRLSIDSLS
jgi:probable addiction module antidote protein